MSKSNEKLRSMADLLRSGATLTSQSCPVCSSPLFKLKSGDLWCGQCEKKVVVVREEEPVVRTEDSNILNETESVILRKIKEIAEKVQEESEIEDLQRLNATMSILLENLERIRKIAKYGT